MSNEGIVQRTNPVLSNQQSSRSPETPWIQADEASVISPGYVDINASALVGSTVDESVEKKDGSLTSKRLRTYVARYIHDPETQSTVINVIDSVIASATSWKVWLAACFLVWFLVQILLVQLSVDASLNAANMRQLDSLDHDFAHNLTGAFDDWKILQQKYPDKFANFSQYLLAARQREFNLRKKLDKLSKAKLERIDSMVVAPAGPPPTYSREEEYELKWSYLSDEKDWPYVGSERWTDLFPQTSRHYYNSLAVFPYSNRTRMHGLVGIYANGTRAWTPAPMPPPIAEAPGGKAAALKNGGFYLSLSNALPLDRDVPDTRDRFCRNEVYHVDELEDVSIIITFYNEHASTLLRSVHSVLNNTPPPLLREILLLDDHSNYTDIQPGGYLYDYIKLLPKTKLMRLPERRGLVQARLAGAKVAKAPVIVILDSHIEVNPFWLEPQLKVLKESPKSVVMPQIMGLNSETFEFSTSSGIGCFLSFKWMMQERPFFDAMKSAAASPSPSMAGGLFAVRRDWFFEAGGYDEEFSMWGAENVEMAFRYWSCGGRVDCAPCSRTYHIFRNGGSGYKSPSDNIRRNRVRTALIWLDEWWQLAKHFLNTKDLDIGPLDKMFELKERLKCKPFSYYMKEVDPKHNMQDMEDVGLLGEIKSLNPETSDWCVDSMSHKIADKPFDHYPCHGDKGSQGWFEDKRERRIRNMSNENMCLGSNIKLTNCNKETVDQGWRALSDEKWIVFKEDADYAEPITNFSEYKCLAASSSKGLFMKDCAEDDVEIEWSFEIFKRDPFYKPLTLKMVREGKHLEYLQ